MKLTCAPSRLFTLEVSEKELQQIEKGLYHDDAGPDEDTSDNYGLWDKVNDVLIDHDIPMLRND
jgi:hypothetical protein